MSKTYQEVKVWLAGDDESTGDEDHIVIQTDTLEGAPGIVRLSTDNKIIGWFDANQLVNAIRTVEAANIPYMCMEKDKV